MAWDMPLTEYDADLPPSRDASADPATTAVLREALGERAVPYDAVLRLP